MKVSARKNFSREFWHGHVEKFKVSGMKQITYSQAHGLKHQTLSAWINRLGKDEGQIKIKSPKARQTTSAVQFAKVIVAPQPGMTENTASMRLSFPGGIALDLAHNFDAASVARLMAAVAGVR